MTIGEIQDKFKKKELKASTLVSDCLEKIKKYEQDPFKINAVITLNGEKALKEAEAIDKKIEKGEKLKKLEGIPIAIKDVIATKGLKTTAASKILENHIPVYDATVISRLKEEGAIIIAKTNCDEFAHGASGENSAWGATKNPFDLKRVPGGSSSGSGAILAYGGAVLSLGTDTGGSVRSPASFLGLVGLKPTYGRVSRKGLLAMCSSIDTIAPITKNVSDSALVLSVIGGKDFQDATSGGVHGKDFTRRKEDGIKGLKIGYPKQFFQRGLDKRVAKIFEDNLKELEKKGAQIKEISWPLFGEPAVAVYYIITPSEISSNLARYDGIKYGEQKKETNNLEEFYLETRTEFLGPEVKRRIMLGNYSLSAGYYEQYYNKAQRVRNLIRKEAQETFKKYDLIATPTTPTPAFELDSKKDPITMYLTDIYTCYANLAGIPAISINGGWIEEKTQSIFEDKENQLPIGLQLMAKWWDEETLIKTAFAFENK